jgi:hypothetical protein
VKSGDAEIFAICKAGAERLETRVGELCRPWVQRTIARHEENRQIALSQCADAQKQRDAFAGQVHADAEGRAMATKAIDDLKIELGVATLNAENQERTRKEVEAERDDQKLDLDETRGKLRRVTESRDRCAVARTEAEQERERLKSTNDALRRDIAKDRRELELTLKRLEGYAGVREIVGARDGERTFDAATRRADEHGTERARLVKKLDDQKMEIYRLLRLGTYGPFPVDENDTLVSAVAKRLEWGAENLRRVDKLEGDEAWAPDVRELVGAREGENVYEAVKRRLNNLTAQVNDWTEVNDRLREAMGLKDGDHVVAAVRRLMAEIAR